MFSLHAGLSAYQKELILFKESGPWPAESPAPIFATENNRQKNQPSCNDIKVIY
jgi:hypothetical protein